jgi:pilus assembly protein CpaC
MKHAALFLFLILALCAGSSRAQEAETSFSLNIDRSETINLPQPADTVFIANPDIADVQVISPTVITVYGRHAGETSLVASKKDGTILLKRKITVNQDVQRLQNVLGEMLPKIQALPVPGGIVLNGQAQSSAEAADAKSIARKFLPGDKDEVINRMKVAREEQILLRVRIAEVSKNVNKLFGVNWDSIGLMAGATFGLKSGFDFIGSSLANNPTRFAGGVADRFTRSKDNNGIYLGYNKGGYAVNALVDALAEDGLATLLAEPSLVAKSGETATFLAGGEFPIPIPQQNGAIAITFKPYGVSLSFTPTLVGKNRISLQVRPEVSELTDTGSIVLNNITIPALLTRRAETTIELGSGQSFAIGGLIRSYQNNDVRKYPFLGDLPIIGALFRSTRFQNDQSELVILVTPYLVQASSQPLASPLDGYSPADDVGRIFNGETYQPGIPNQPRRVGETLQGPVGFTE